MKLVILWLLILVPKGFSFVGKSYENQLEVVSQNIIKPSHLMCNFITFLFFVPLIELLHFPWLSSKQNRFSFGCLPSICIIKFCL